MLLILQIFYHLLYFYCLLYIYNVSYICPLGNGSTRPVRPLKKKNKHRGPRKLCPIFFWFFNKIFAKMFPLSLPNSPFSSGPSSIFFSSSIGFTIPVYGNFMSFKRAQDSTSPMFDPDSLIKPLFFFELHQGAGGFRLTHIPLANRSATILSTPSSLHHLRMGCL